MTLHAGEHLIEKELTWSIIGAFFAVYRKLGYGFVEHIYVMALEKELLRRGHHVAREVQIAVFYDAEVLGHQRMDMVVDGRAIVEAKSTENLHPDAPRQLFNYLCATNIEVGLLLHFGPRARFYRKVCENSRKRALRPLDSLKSVDL